MTRSGLIRQLQVEGDAARTLNVVKGASSPPPPPSFDYLLLPSADFVLLPSGDKIILP